MLDTLKKITMSCRKVFIRSFYKSGSSRLETCRDDNFLLNNTVKGFTLIELLVVVLIIGILASVALPQYQVAVMKGRLATYMPLVKAVYEAQELYYLENGQYTTDLTLLNIDFPASGCTYTSTQAVGSYDCPSYKVGVFDGPTNAQAGNSQIRLLKFFEPDARFDTKKGDMACFSRGEVARKACRSLGPGREEHVLQSWDYQYILPN